MNIKHFHIPLIVVPFVELNFNNLLTLLEDVIGGEAKKNNFST
jgi:hypothetical protein